MSSRFIRLVASIIIAFAFICGVLTLVYFSLPTVVLFTDRYYLDMNFDRSMLLSEKARYVLKGKRFVIDEISYVQLSDTKSLHDYLAKRVAQLHPQITVFSPLVTLISSNDEQLLGAHPSVMVGIGMSPDKGTLFDVVLNTLPDDEGWLAAVTHVNEKLSYVTHSVAILYDQNDIHAYEIVETITAGLEDSNPILIEQNPQMTKSVALQHVQKMHSLQVITVLAPSARYIDEYINNSYPMGLMWIVEAQNKPIIPNDVLEGWVADDVLLSLDPIFDVGIHFDKTAPVIELPLRRVFHSNR